MLVLFLGGVILVFTCLFVSYFFWSFLWHGVWPTWPFGIWFRWFTISPWLWNPFWLFGLPWAWLGLPALLLVVVVIVLYGKSMKQKST